MQDNIPSASAAIPSISVVLGNYNHARFLPRAIESVTNQSLAPDEFLIVDDASTDNSLEIIESYAAQHSYIKLYRNEKNLGVIGTYRRLFELAQGNYIHPLAADDERSLTLIERALEMGRRFPEAGLIFGDMSIFSEAGEIEGHVSAGAWNEPLFVPPERYLNEYMLYEKPSHSLVGAAVFRRQPFLDVGCYQEELGSWGDTFSFHAVALRHGACYVPETFAIWHKQRASYSQQSICDPRNTLDMIHRASQLMRSERFRDRFPESFVREWSKRYRWQVAEEYWRGDHSGELPPNASWRTRMCYRLPRTFEAISLLLHRTDLSSINS